VDDGPERVGRRQIDDGAAEDDSDDADSQVSMENTNQNCWQVRVRDLRELQ